MGWIQRFRNHMRAVNELQTRGTLPQSVLPPSRSSSGVSTETALTLSSFYRGVFIHATAVCQLALAVERDDVQLEQQPSIIKRPDLNETRSAFLEYTTVSLWTNGNAFWLKTRGYDGREVVSLRPLNPNEVHVARDRKTEKPVYTWRGTEYGPSDIQHLKLLRIPGLERGLGPIEACRLEIQGALEARDYGSLWFSESDVPSGVLSSDQALTNAEARAYRYAWHGLDENGEPYESDDRQLHDIRVLGKGLNYTPLLLKPADVQFLERQQFDTISIARMLGIPPTLMAAAVEGNSETYSNVEQEWIMYVRFGLMKALREIEEAFTEILPGRQVARFKLENLYRADTKTRYEAYNLAISAGWMTPDEVRGRESLAPMTPEQQASAAIARAKTAVPQETADV